MMRWYTLWKLRRANAELEKALAGYPDNAMDDIITNAKPVARWLLADLRVRELLVELGVDPTQRGK